MYSFCSSFNFGIDYTLLVCFLYIFYHASFRIQSYHSPNQTMIAENGFFSKINSFLVATARSIYSSNFSHILKHSESRGNTPIRSRCFKIDSTLTGTWVFGSSFEPLCFSTYKIINHLSAILL